MMESWIIDGWIYFRFRIYRYTHDNARFIVKQARLESGNYTSVAFDQDNNIFGMSRVQVRPTTQVGWRLSGDGVNTIGRYASLSGSLQDRKMWDDYNKINFRAPANEYIAQVLEAGYNNSTVYRDRVLAVGDQVEEAIKNAKVGASAIVLFVAAIFVLKNKSL